MLISSNIADERLTTAHRAKLAVWSRNEGSAWLISPHSGTRHLTLPPSQQDD